MRRAFYRTLTPVTIFTPSGLYTCNSFSMTLEGRRLERIFDKTIRGMYWHECNEQRLSDGYRSLYHQVGKPPPLQGFADSERQICDFPERVIGNDVFAYRRVIFAEEPGLSVWRFEFYRSIAFMGYTFRQNERETTMPHIRDAPEEAACGPLTTSDP
jgi:hypothetical protein